MNKIKYLFKTIKNMDFKAMFEIINKIHKKTKKSKIYLFFDIIYCGLKYQAGYMDYFTFELYNVPNSKRNTYITRGVNNNYVRILNDRSLDYLLDDKAETLKLFKDYVKRDWVDLRVCSLKEFEKFALNHNFIAKKYNGTGGHNMDFYYDVKKEQVKEIYEKCQNNEQYVVEQIIKQHPDVNKIYADAINTLRIVTIKSKVVFVSMRIAQKGKVDNLHEGGMAVIIDPKTGVITTPAADKNDDVYYKHPKSNITFRGYKIPFVKEACDIATHASKLLPKVGYIGWDFAVTENGIDFVEANLFPGNDIYQYQVHLENKIGLKPIFDKAIKE